MLKGARKASYINKYTSDKRLDANGSTAHCKELSAGTHCLHERLNCKRCFGASDFRFGLLMIMLKANKQGRDGGRKLPAWSEWLFGGS